MFFNQLNSPIVTVYLYLMVFCVFFVLYQDLSRNQNLTLFADVHNKSADRVRKMAFTVTLLTFLGTPVTLGFSYKLVVLQNVGSAAWTLGAAVAINLIMLVFYLQTARHPQLARKKKTSAASKDANTASAGALILACALSCFAVLVAPVAVDILSALTL